MKKTRRNRLLFPVLSVAIIVAIIIIIDVCWLAVTKGLALVIIKADYSQVLVITSSTPLCRKKTKRDDMCARWWPDLKCCFSCSLKIVLYWMAIVIEGVDSTQ